MAFLSFFYCFSVNLFAQGTNPTPQALPYTQNFDALPASSTTFLPNIEGWQGWQASASQNTAIYNTGLIGDKLLVANSTAAINSGNLHNYNGQVGFLNSTSVDLAIGFAFSSTNNTGIIVQYDAMIIRNLYDGAGVNRLQEMALQYRVGTTGIFTTLLSTAYSNNSTTPQTGAVTTPLDGKKTRVSVTLPAACDNQPVVQIRWIARLASGSAGARQSFAIDNIDIRQDIVAPVNAVGYPIIDNVLSDGFNFSNQIDEIGKTYYVLVPSNATAPVAAQIKAGLNGDGTAALQSGFLDVTDKSLVYEKSFTGLTLNTAYSVYSISEDAYGNIQATVVKQDATTSNVLVPSLTTTVSSLDLGFSEANFSTSSLNYQIQGTNISSPVTVTAPANFTVSKDNTNFQTSVVYNVVDFAANATPTVYVRFMPTAVGSFLGQITHESTGATTKTVALTGTGINPYIQDFNDANVLTNSGWTAYNVAGVTNKWKSTTTNAHTAPGAVVMNGYSDTGTASKDWLISPKLRLNSFNNYPLLSFYTRKYFAGPSLKLMVSVDYDGTSSPETANWTELVGNFPSVTAAYAQSQYIDLGSYKTDHTYLAWVYETVSGGGSGNAAEWTLDDVAITDDLGFVASNPNLDFGDVSPNAVSTGKSFVFKAGGYGDTTITAPADYQVSIDNSNFQSSIVITEGDALLGKTVYARFTPSTKALTIAGSLTVTGTGLNKQIGTLTGSSLPKADTFDIVTYNLEFFGSDVKGSDGKEFGPIDDALQIDNVAKVMNKLDADVYVVQEVSDEVALDALIQKISINGKTFDKTISPKWSYSFNPPQADFPPQKLVVIYNTKTTTVKNTRVMFSKLYDGVRAGTQTLPNYPGTAASFFSSGRLPYMVEIETNIGGVKKDLTLIDIHARANSGTDITKYNMRKYDAEFLKDSLDANYPDTNFIILGDYNDDVKKTVVNDVLPSSYEKMVKDTDRYNALTLGISNAGAFSFLSSGGFLDHIIISNELTSEYITNSTAVYDPRTDVTNYVNTTSDHGPVIARFELKSSSLATIDFEEKNGFAVKAYPNPATDVVNVLVKTNDNKKLKLRLYDMTGRMIGNPIDVNGGQEKSTSVIQISDLNSGIYIYTLTENNKVVFKDKIIKK
jgi:hypothetical protein